MALDVALLGGFYAFAVCIAIAFFLQRFSYRWRRRMGKSNWGFYPSSASMGNAFHELSVLTQPQARYVLEEKLCEEVDEDEEGGPKDPIAHLHREFRRKRKQKGQQETHR